MTQEVKASKQRATVGRFDVSETFFRFLLFSMLFFIRSYFNTVLFRAPEGLLNFLSGCFFFLI